MLTPNISFYIECTFRACFTEKLQKTGFLKQNISCLKEKSFHVQKGPKYPCVPKWTKIYCAHIKKYHCNREALWRS